MTEKSLVDHIAEAVTRELNSQKTLVQNNTTRTDVLTHNNVTTNNSSNNTTAQNKAKNKTTQEQKSSTTTEKPEQQSNPEECKVEVQSNCEGNLPPTSFAHSLDDSSGVSTKPTVNQAMDKAGVCSELDTGNATANTDSDGSVSSPKRLKIDLEPEGDY